MTTTARPGQDGPYGYQQITSLSAATGLTIPGGGTALIGGSTTPSDVNAALIQAETQNVRWRDDGTNPTSSAGMILVAGDSFLYTGDLNRIKFIEVTASAKLNISYYTIPQF